MDLNGTDDLFSMSSRWMTRAFGAFPVTFYASFTPPQVLLCPSKATIDQHEAYGERAMQSVCQDSVCQLGAWWSHPGRRESAS